MDFLRGDAFDAFRAFRVVIQAITGLRMPAIMGGDGGFLKSGIEPELASVAFAVL
jgi:hypothetical protein